MSASLSKLCADHLREFCTSHQASNKLKASHARELAAAFFGYQSHAALIAEKDHPPDGLDDAEILIPDVPLMDRRRARLKGLSRDLPSSMVLAERLSGFLSNKKLFIGQVWLYGKLEDYIVEVFLPEHQDEIDDKFVGAMAETNAAFTESPYYESRNVNVRDCGDELIITVTAEYEGEHHDDRMFAGDSIDMQVRIRLFRTAGKRGFTSLKMEVEGAANNDWVDPDVRHTKDAMPMPNRKDRPIDNLEWVADALIAEIQKMDISSTELSRRDHLPELLEKHRSLAQEAGAIIVRAAFSGASQRHEEALNLLFTKLVGSKLSNERTVGSWIHLYPICLLFNLAGISAVAGENDSMLATLFHVQVDDGIDRISLLETVAGYLECLQGEGVLLSGFRPQGIGRSSHFLKTLRPMLSDAGISMDDEAYRRFFDRYEALQAAAFCQLAGVEHYKIFVGHFSMRSVPHNGIRVNSFFLELIKEYGMQSGNWPPLKEGIFKRDGREIGNVLNELSQILVG